MPLLTSNTVIYCSPQARQRVVQKTLKRAGIPVIAIQASRNPVVQQLSDDIIGDRMKVAIVSNPVNWYLSRFATIKGGSRRSFQPSLTAGEGNRLQSKFNQRVQQALKGKKTATRAYNRLLGQNLDKVAFIGTFEKLPASLCDALQKANENFDRTTAERKMKRSKSSKARKPRQLFSADALNAVLEADKQVMEKLGYSTLPGDYRKSVRRRKPRPSKEQ